MTRPPSALDVIPGRRAALEALRSDRDVRRLFVAQGLRSEGIVAEILAAARDRGVDVVEVPATEIGRMAAGDVHQGVLVVARPRAPASVDAILARAAERNEPPFVVVLDGVEDPQNVGAVLRVADGAGAHGVVVGARGAAGLTPGAVRASAGASEHVLVASEPDLARALARFAEAGCAIVGTDADRGVAPWEARLAGALALVMGSEQRGLSRPVEKRCTAFVRIPLRGALQSLNVATATAVLAFERLRQEGAR